MAVAFAGYYPSVDGDFIVALDRREMLKLGVLGTVAMALPAERVARARKASNRIAASKLPKPFTTRF
jgi:hypothetical protein